LCRIGGGRFLLTRFTGGIVGRHVIQEKKCATEKNYFSLDFIRLNISQYDRKRGINPLGTHAKGQKK
jgi:hypothetical protein